jgi:hypothetical protein
MRILILLSSAIVIGCLPRPHPVAPAHGSVPTAEAPPAPPATGSGREALFGQAPMGPPPAPPQPYPYAPPAPYPPPGSPSAQPPPAYPPPQMYPQVP